MTVVPLSFPVQGAGSRLSGQRQQGCSLPPINAKSVDLKGRTDGNSHLDDEDHAGEHRD